MALAILRDVPDAGPGGLARRRVRQLDARQLDAALVRGAHARDGLDQLALAVAVDAGDAHDLAGGDLHREAAHGVEPAVVAHPQLAYREHVGARMRGAARDVEQHLAAHHQLGQAALAGALPVDRRDLLAAPQHRDAVGHLEHLVQLVRDQDHRGAAGHERAQHGEQLVDLLRRQHRGRLVEDQDARVAVERLEDLDALLLADADLLDHGIRLHGEAVARGQLAHALARRVEVELAVVLRLVAEHDVLDDRHHGDQHEVLVHHADAEADRVGRACDARRLARARRSPPRPACRGRRGRS